MHFSFLHLVYLCVCLCVGQVQRCFCTTPAAASTLDARYLEGKRTISFSLGYLTGLDNLHMGNSNTALSGFFQELEQGYGAVFDWVSSYLSSKTGRSILSVFETFVLTYVRLPAIITSYHEFGHFSRWKAGGADPYFSKPFADTKNIFKYVGLYLGFGIHDGLFYHYFSRANGQTTRGEATFLPASRFQGVSAATEKAMRQAFAKDGKSGVDKYIRVHKTDPDVKRYENSENDEDIMTTAAGVNNTMRLGGDLSDALWHAKGHVASSVLYGRLKTNMWSYPLRDGSDPNFLIKDYAQKGITLTKKDMNRGNALALFLSASTWAYAWGWVDFVRNGNTVVPRAEVFGVRLPDVENYFLIEGMSYKVKTGYRWKDLYIPLECEFVTIGAKGCEVTVGGEYTFPQLQNLSIGGHVRFGRAFDWDITLRQPIAKRFFIEGTVEHHSLKGFNGQRNIATLEKDVKAMTVLLRAGWIY